jgi:peptidoglycan/LPS O-acetylase OafA/YrhL
MSSVLEPSTSYRRDIDGLRAVAILSVVAFHTAPNLVPGGFVGVDIFFVISGYLITGIILSDLARGKFSFVEFYARRIRRIFPALTLVLACVLCLGWLKLLPNEYTSLRQHVGAGAAYVSNFLLFKESGYFDASSELKPLLHLWSLGVEEQFYIFWPLLLFAVAKLRRAQWPFMLGIAAASFALNVAFIHSHPAATFYLPQARLWELSLGGILAYVRLRQNLGQTGLPAWLTPLIRGPGAAVGLGLLGFSIVALDKNQLFPGWWALAPTVGTLWLIAASEHSWINRNVLGNRPMVFVGQISYPLYLWHWPLLSFTRILEPDDTSAATRLLAVTVAFILSFLTYRYLELPIRSIRPATRAAAPLFACTAGVGMAAFVSLLLNLNPLSSTDAVQRILGATTERAFPGQRLKAFDTPGGKLLAQEAGPARVLFLGDSNIEQYYPRIDRLLMRDRLNSRSVVFASNGGCVPILGVREAHHAYCDGLVARAIAYASDPRVDTIVIGAAWYSYLYDRDPRYSYYFEDDNFRGPLAAGTEGARRAWKSFDAMIRTFTSQRKHVILILQIPVGNALDPQKMIERSLLSTAVTINSPPLIRSTVVSEIAPISALLREIAARHGATVIDPLNELCDHTSCATVDRNGLPMYRDSGHLRPSYVRDNVGFLDSVIHFNNHAGGL